MSGYEITLKNETEVSKRVDLSIFGSATYKDGQIFNFLPNSETVISNITANMSCVHKCLKKNFTEGFKLSIKVTETFEDVTNG